MHFFPTELLVIIFSKLDFKSRLVCKTVCWRWLEILMTFKKFNQDQTLYLYDCNLSDNMFPVQMLKNIIFQYARVNIIISHAFQCNSNKLSNDIWNKIKHINVYSFYDDRIHNLLDSWICSSNRLLKLTILYKNGISQIKEFKQIYFHHQPTSSASASSSNRTHPVYDSYIFKKITQLPTTMAASVAAPTTKTQLSIPIQPDKQNNYSLYSSASSSFTCSRSKLHLNKSVIAYVDKSISQYHNDFKFKFCDNVNDDNYYMNKYNFILKDITSLDIVYKHYNDRFRYVGIQFALINKLTLTTRTFEDELCVLIPKKYPNLNILKMKPLNQLSMKIAKLTNFDNLLINLPFLKHLIIDFMFVIETDDNSNSVAANDTLTTSLINYGKNLQVNFIKYFLYLIFIIRPYQIDNCYFSFFLLFFRLLKYVAWN